LLSEWEVSASCDPFPVGAVRRLTSHPEMVINKNQPRTRTGIQIDPEFTDTSSKVWTENMFASIELSLSSSAAF
jgi:hypothetical protein